MIDATLDPATGARLPHPFLRYSDHMKTINVEHLPEPIARAVQAMVETLKVQLPPANAANTQPRKRIEFRRKPGRALTDLRRADTWRGDVPLPTRF